jgi:hypothetical protein
MTASLSSPEARLRALPDAEIGALTPVTGEHRRQGDGAGGWLLLNYLVGGRQQRLRDRKAERLGGFEVDDHLDFHRLLDR